MNLVKRDYLGVHISEKTASFSRGRVSERERESSIKSLPQRLVLGEQLRGHLLFGELASLHGEVM